ncbi:MAG: tryptophan--tRNA ligase [Candidatus Eremiobacteraeota bacterium]|nr:tryptophan--tRNA ligase [Candidatus Eremiobacteraeota bacterium]
MEKIRVLSGMRPTGKLHLGHLLGAIQNWLWLQSQEQYECFFMMADWHALSTAFRESEHIAQNTIEVATDYMAAGLDPEKVTFYIQSHVPQIAELFVLYAMITPTAWVTRVPSYKGQIRELGDDIDTYGFLGYPVLMACDILAFKAERVPVGQDQVPHLELTREMLRRFHYIFGKEIFPEPEALLTKTPLVPGIDGRKMSKSYNNAILISDEPDVIRTKIKSFFTDPQKIHMGDPGHPEGCPVFFYQGLYNKDKVEEIERDCKGGKLGCVACKKELAENLIREIAPIQEKRKELESRPDFVKEVLFSGGEIARKVAEETLKEAREVVNLL